MCLKPRSLPPIPDNTRSVAEQIYPPDHPLRRLGEDYADVLCDQDFADLYSSTGKPALSPALLALVTVLQATEHCSDRVAAEMVRSRIDWKYALHLPLAHPGFDASVLCEFRQRLVTHHAERRVFDAFLRRLKERGFLKGRETKPIKNTSLLNQLRKIEPGRWSKVYHDGLDQNGKEVSVHYCQSPSGKVFDLETKPGWSNK